MDRINRFIKSNWKNFWYEYPSHGNISYGSMYKIKPVFRKQRLYNVVVGIVLIIILFKVL